MNTIKYLATFTPQAWVNDQAIEIDVDEGDTQEWDCTRFVHEHLDYFAQLQDRETDPDNRVGGDPGLLDNDDMLKQDPDAPEWVHEHRGPFDIHIAVEIDDYLALFIHGYCLAMLWANTRFNDDVDGNQDVDPYWWQTSANPNWGIDAFDPDSQEQIKEDCGDFVRAAALDLTAAYLLGERTPLHTEDKQYRAEQAGHDFALTRNHHGAGFWDRGLGQIGDRLTKLAHPYGESNAWIYQNDDPANDNKAHLD